MTNTFKERTTTKSTNQHYVVTVKRRSVQTAQFWVSAQTLEEAEETSIVAIGKDRRSSFLDWKWDRSEMHDDEYLEILAYDEAGDFAFDSEPFYGCIYDLV